MMAPSWTESTWEINDYGRFINQFPPNIIRSIRQFESINKKYVDKKCPMKYVYTNLYIYIYIIFHRQTVLLYYNSSVWLDTLDASSWDRIPPTFLLDLVSNHSAISVTYVRSGIIKQMYLPSFVYTLHYCKTRELNSLDEL